MKKKNIIVLIIVIVFILLFWAPWMTENWCKQQAIGYRLNNGRIVDESWIASVSWMPFGRKVDMRLPEAESPSLGVVGGWGYSGFMSFWGDLYSVIGI